MMVTTTFPQASQVLDSRGRVLKWARCPLPGHQDAHGRGRRSSEFLAEQQEFDGARTWLFRCKHGGKPFHNFTALPDPDTPRTKEALEEWKLRQIEIKKIKDKGYYA